MRLLARQGESEGQGDGEGRLSGEDVDLTGEEAGEDIVEEDGAPMFHRYPRNLLPGISGGTEARRSGKNQGGSFLFCLFSGGLSDIVLARIFDDVIRYRGLLLCTFFGRVTECSSLLL